MGYVCSAKTYMTPFVAHARAGRIGLAADVSAWQQAQHPHLTTQEHGHVHTSSRRWSRVCGKREIWHRPSTHTLKAMYGTQL